MQFENAAKDDIVDFFLTASNFHHLLKFTHTASKQAITFLDTTVFEGKTVEKYWISKMHTTPAEFHLGFSFWKYEGLFL